MNFWQVGKVSLEKLRKVGIYLLKNIFYYDMIDYDIIVVYTKTNLDEISYFPSKVPSKCSFKVLKTD